MTSSHYHSSDRSSPDNQNPLDDATRNIEVTDTRDDRIKNLDIDSKDILEDSVVIKPSEPKITMTSPSPDVVIATVEDPKTDDLIEDKTIQTPI